MFRLLRYFAWRLRFRLAVRCMLTFRLRRLLFRWRMIRRLGRVLRSRSMVTVRATRFRVSRLGRRRFWLGLVFILMILLLLWAFRRCRIRLFGRLVIWGMRLLLRFFFMLGCRGRLACIRRMRVTRLRILAGRRLRCRVRFRSFVGLRVYVRSLLILL